MKNKMNCGCCDTLLKTCRICVGSDCVLISETGKYIVTQEHPDAGLPGFTSSGRLFASFLLSTSEAGFAAVFDYADDSNYYAAVVTIDQTVPQNTQVILRIVRVLLGSYSIVEERVIFLGVNLDATAHEGFLCVSWSPAGIFATVEWEEGVGHVLEAAKASEFSSGRVAFFINDSVLGSNYGYFRFPGSVTDEGVCPPCDTAAPVVCDCCPSAGFALAWELDFSAAVINNEGWVECDQIPGIYILDRVSQACVAQHSQFYTGEYIDAGCTGGTYKTTVSIQLTIGVDLEGNCTLSLGLGINPDINAPCAYTGLFATYRKTFSTEITEEGCSGTHVLDLVFNRLDTFRFGMPCSGSLPTTVTVTSIA